MQVVRWWSLRPTTTITTTTESRVSGGAAQTEQAVVAVDANGADLGPSEVIAGVREAAAQGARILLFGPARQIENLAPLGPRVELVDAPVSIAKSPDPAKAVRAAPEASIVQAAKAVGEGRAQALVCAGGTGAALAAGLFNIKRARGIHRPALALPIPVPKRPHPVTLLDVGASVQARPEHLVQFAFMGAAFARAVLGVENPRVALLSNGEEAERGSEPVVRAGTELASLARNGRVAWVGNIEGNELVGGRADVIVCDGFTGNIALKLMEGVSQTVLAAVRDAALSSWRGKLGGVLLRLESARLSRADRPRSPGWGLPARSAPPRGRCARTVWRARLCPGDRARPTGRPRKRGRRHARRPQRCRRAAQRPDVRRSG